MAQVETVSPFGRDGGLRITRSGARDGHRRQLSEPASPDVPWARATNQPGRPDPLLPEALANPMPIDQRKGGLSIQFGLVPAAGQSLASPRLEGSGWDAIDERMQLMAQLHVLQDKIAQLARRGNERIGVSPRLLADDDSREWASPSLTSSETLFEDDSEWPEPDASSEELLQLRMNVEDWRKVQQFRKAAEQFETAPGLPTVGAAARQLAGAFAALLRAVLRSPGGLLVLTGALVAVIAVYTYRGPIAQSHTTRIPQPSMRASQFALHPTLQNA